MRESTSAAARLGAGVAAGLLLAALTGCSQMDVALSKQWIVVDFNPSTSMATELHVRAACSHIQNAPPMAVPAQHSEINIMYGVRFDTTNASPANLAQLQTCLQKFSSVAGLEPETAGDEGS
ncbi:MAG: hypothetical protein ACLQFR_18010 [Streptosporangiaceae bacterium]